jgi:hypothetical protein
MGRHLAGHTILSNMAYLLEDALIAPNLYSVGILSVAGPTFAMELQPPIKSLVQWLRHWLSAEKRHSSRVIASLLGAITTARQLVGDAASIQTEATKRLRYPPAVPPLLSMTRPGSPRGGSQIMSSVFPTRAGRTSIAGRS